MKKEERQNLATYLRWGDKTTIAKLAGVDRRTVEKWLAGEVKNSTAAPYIIAFANKRKIEIEKLISAQFANQ